MPFVPVFRDVFEVKVAGESEGRRFGAPTRQTGIAVCAVTHDREVVRDRLRPDSEFGDDSSFVAHDLPSAIALNYSGADNGLGEILIGSTDDHLADALVLGCIERGRCQRVVRLKVNHWPYEHAHCAQCFFQNGKLRKQLRRHSLTRLITRI